MEKLNHYFDERTKIVDERFFLCFFGKYRDS